MGGASLPMMLMDPKSLLRSLWQVACRPNWAGAARGTDKKGQRRLLASLGRRLCWKRPIEPIAITRGANGAANLRQKIKGAGATKILFHESTRPVAAPPPASLALGALCWKLFPTRRHAKPPCRPRRHHSTNTRVPPTTATQALMRFQTESKACRQPALVLSVAVVVELSASPSLPRVADEALPAEPTAPPPKACSLPG